MNENITKLVIFGGCLAIGYIIGNNKIEINKCHGCEIRDYVINELKIPAYARDPIIEKKYAKIK